MSDRALRFAADRSPGPGLLDVFLVLARRADPDGRNAYRRVATIAELVGCSPRTVQRRIAALLAAGYLREGDQSITLGRYPNDERPINYDCATTERTRQEWARAYTTAATPRKALADAGRRHGTRGAAMSRYRPVNGDSPKLRPDPPTDLSAVTGGDLSAVTGEDLLTRVPNPGDLSLSRSEPHPGGPQRRERERPAGIQSPIVFSAPGGAPEPAAEPTEPLVDLVLALAGGNAAAAPVSRQDARMLVAKVASRAHSPRAYLRAMAERGDLAAALAEVAAPSAPTRPPWCGSCEERTRMVEVPGRDALQRCPVCSGQPATLSQPAR